VTEVGDAINGGKTTALILTGGVEANGPHLAQGKHNYVLRQTGDAIARRLGDALIAPIVTLEPTGNVGADVRIGLAGPKISQGTYLALLTDIGDNLRAMGFTTILYLGDSGGNRNGMHGAANALNEKYEGNPANFYHIPEYYDYRSVQEYIQNQLGIPEQIRLGGSNGWADSIHEEYGIDALMALEDPDTIRFYQRVEAGRAVINGVPLEPLETLLDHARQFLEVRTRLTVAGIDKALASPPPVYGQPQNQ
jgi:creatinine amidohydrolase